jgi:hypothetical protein
MYCQDVLLPTRHRSENCGEDPGMLDVVRFAGHGFIMDGLSESFSCWMSLPSPHIATWHP